MKLLRVKRYCSQRFGSSEKSARPMELSNETLSRRNCIGRQTRLFSQPKHSKVAVKTGLGGTRRRVKFVELFSAPSARYHFHRNFSINQCLVLDIARSSSSIVRNFSFERGAFNDQRTWNATHLDARNIASQSHIDPTVFLGCRSTVQLQEHARR